jgi:hypothetical protein
MNHQGEQRMTAVATIPQRLHQISIAPVIPSPAGGMLIVVCPQIAQIAQI